VVSVGPQQLTTSRSGQRSRIRATCAGDTVSLPVRTRRRPSNSRGSWSTSSANSDAVACSTVTPDSATHRAISWGPYRTGGASTSRAPPTSGAQTSNVDTSKEGEAIWRSTSSGRSAMVSPPCSSSVTLRCRVTTPLGLPVDPDVKIT
jgi:hypothetical protein